LRDDRIVAPFNDLAFYYHPPHNRLIFGSRMLRRELCLRDKNSLRDSRDRDL